MAMIDIEKILATPVRILVYVGDMNYKYNWRGQKKWLSMLDWIGQVEFNKASDKDWISYVSGTKAGTVKSYRNIAFVKVFDAGQFVRIFLLLLNVFIIINIHSIVLGDL